MKTDAELQPGQRDEDEAGKALMALIDAANAALLAVWMVKHKHPKLAGKLITTLDTARVQAAALHTDIIEE